MKIKNLILIAVGVAMTAMYSCQPGAGGGKVSMTSKTDSASYALGVLIGENNRRQMDMTPGADQLNIDILVAAMGKALHGEEVAITAESANTIVRSYFESVASVENEKYLAEGQAFLEKNKEKEGIVTLESGLQYEVLKEGNGPTPKETDTVSCHYHGTLIDGTVFDSSIDRGEPAEFPVTGVIKGWVEALQLMPVGSKWRLYIPTELAYGENPRPGGEIKPNMALIFELELLGIK